MKKSFILCAMLLILCGYLLADTKGIKLESEIEIEPIVLYPEIDLRDLTFYKVVKVIDGNTVIVNIDEKEIRVRLIGVMAFGTIRYKKKNEYLSKEATAFTTNLLKGEYVRVVYDPSLKKDKHDRTLAYLFRVPDGLFVNLEIVRQGYGHALAAESFKYHDLFKHYQGKAVEVQKALWVNLIHGSMEIETKTPPEPKSPLEDTDK